MPRIAAVATAVPPHRVTQEEAAARLASVFADAPDRPLLLRVLRSAGVDERQYALPPDRTARSRGFAARMAEWVEAATPLAERAARAALARAEVEPRAVDLLMTVSCTGLRIPSLGATLCGRLGLRTDVVRLPVTELGCAAGAAGIARATDYVRAWPSGVALVVAVEISSACFRPDDDARTQLVASTIFGDGAAAAVLTGAGRRARPGPEVVATMSHLWPESDRLMGFDVEDDGFRLVLDRDVPEFLRGRVVPVVGELCRRVGVAPSEIEWFAVHPGGRRILMDLEEELARPGCLAGSFDVLRRHGNMSSATVLYVLDEVMRARTPPRVGSWGLLAAFGPGFAAELALLRWEV